MDCPAQISSYPDPCVSISIRQTPKGSRARLRAAHVFLWRALCIETLTPASIVAPKHGAPSTSHPAVPQRPPIPPVCSLFACSEFLEFASQRLPPGVWSLSVSLSCPLTLLWLSPISPHLQAPRGQPAVVHPRAGAQDTGCHLGAPGRPGSVPWGSRARRWENSPMDPRGGVGEAPSR